MESQYSLYLRNLGTYKSTTKVENSLMSFWLIISPLLPFLLFKYVEKERG